MEQYYKFDESGNIILDPDIMAYSEFKAIWDKDKLLTKEMAFKVYNYIYHRCSKKSKVIREGYNDSEAIEYAMTISKINKNDFTTWGTLIENAIRRFKREDENNLDLLFTNINRSLNKANKIAAKIDNQVETLLAGEINVGTIKDMLNLQKEIFGIIDNVPKYISLLNEAKEAVNAELKIKAKLLRGKLPHKPSMDNDNDLIIYTDDIIE